MVYKMGGKYTIIQNHKIESATVYNYLGVNVGRTRKERVEEIIQKEIKLTEGTYTF